MQSDGKQQDQQQSNPIHRERNADIGESESEPVGETARICGAENPKRNTEDSGEQHRRAGKLQRFWKALADVARDWPIGHIGMSEITVRDVADVMAEASDQWIIEMQ